MTQKQASRSTAAITKDQIILGYPVAQVWW